MDPLAVLAGLAGLAGRVGGDVWSAKETGGARTTKSNYFFKTGW